MELLKAPEFSDEESFVLCDIATKGFPILHASPGFQKLYGLSEAECTASSCGKLVGAESIQKDPLALAAGLKGVPEVAGGVDGSLTLMQDVMSDFVDDVAHQREPDFPSVLVVNRKSNGQLFTCQMSLLRKHHPELGWSYLVGLQLDVSGQVPVPELFKAAAQGRDRYKALCNSHAQRSKLAERLQTEGAESHFHGVMRSAWRGVLSRQMSEGSCAKLQKSRSAEEQTIASVSTACSLTSVAAKKDSDKTETSPEAGWGRSMSWSPDACFHLGAIAKSSSRISNESTIEETPSTNVPCVCSERFLDLLEEFDDDAEPGVPAAVAEAAQAAKLNCPELEELDVPVFMVSPKKDSPLVLCSHSFAKMLGFETAAIPRSSLWQLFHTVPEIADQVEQADLQQLLDREAQVQAFWAAAGMGEFYQETKASTSNMKYDCKPQGELFIVGDFLRQDGRSLRTAVYLKQVELDEEMLIAGVARPFPQMSAWKATYDQLNDHVDEAIEVMAAEFFYSAPMRRQTAVGALV